MQNNQQQQALKKRLYQNLLNKSPRHQYLLDSQSSKLAPVLKPKVVQQTLNQTAKKPFTTFQKGKLLIQNQTNQIKSPQIPKKIAPINQNKQKLSKQAKAIIQQGKLKSKANLKPHDIFAFYDAFPQMMEDFFYLNRISHPYDYQIVTYSQRNQNEYMTISSKGVTLYHDKDAEFLTKQEWLADQKNYFLLQKIEFFKQYKICKNFLIWKNRMRRHYMKEMSSLLNQNLFLSSIHPRNCLLEVIKITNNLKDSLYFMPDDSIQSMKPQFFLQNVLKHIDSVFLPKLKGLQDMIVEELEKSIFQEIKRFKLQNNIKIEQVGSKDQSQSNKQGYVYSQQAILRKQYKKILKLIKLTDNLLLESKIDLVQKCVTQILQKILQARSNQLKEQWITCTAYTLQHQDLVQNTSVSNKIYWNPDMEGLKNIFRTIINEAVTKINQKYQKISSRQIFQKYKINQQSESRKDDRKSTIKFMIEDSQFFYPLLKKIEEYLADQFQKSKNQENSLIKFIDIYTKHKSLPPVKELFSLHTASQLCQLVRQWKTDNLQMQQLPDNKSIGLLVFNYAQLRKKMVSAPSQTLASFLSVLPEETSSKCRNLSHESKVLLDMINIYPIDIKSFVSFNKCVRIATQKLDQLIDGGKQVIQMVTLIQQNKLANIDIYKGRSKQVMTSIGNLKSKVDQNNAKFDHSLSKFKKQIEVNIQKIKSSVKDLICKFQVIPFDTLSSPILTTLQKIQQIMPVITNFQQQSLQIQQTQIQLNLPETNFQQIHLLFEKSRIVHQLWRCKKQWNQLLLSIYNKHYCVIDCLQIKTKWEEFYIKGLQLQKKFHDSQVLKKMNLQIGQFQNLIDTISHLRSPNLQEKSWKEISQYLAYQLSIQNQNQLPFSHRENPQYTIQWLIKNNISLYKEKISFIVQKSQKQKQLHLSLGQFRNFLSNFSIQTIVKKRQIPLLTENANLKQNLKQKITLLYSMIGNQYSQNIKIEAEVLIKQYQYVQQILEHLYNFAKMWQKYQAFFQPNAVSIKLLAKQSKQFTSWQLQWKKIIRNIISDPAYFYKKICDQTTGLNCSRAIVKAINKVNGLLDMIKKGVDEFLQKKRIQYPKYFFFSDQELLKMLCKLDNRQLINAQIIPLIFDSIKFIEYEQESSTVISVTLKNGQYFPLLKQSNFKSQLQIEDIFKLTEQQIKKTMNNQIRTVFLKYIQEEITRQDLIKENNLQISMCIDFITWVRLAQQTYLTVDPLGSLCDWLMIQDSQIKELNNLIQNQQNQIKFKATQLLCQSIYFRQKTQALSKRQILLTDQYQWERIPKLMMSNSQIYLKQVNSKINYCFQLLLPQQIRIIFAQNQRNWINLINSISSKHFISLNNGKQTLVDLSFYIGQNLKQFCISNDCHVKTIQKLLNAIVYTGCWGYFPKIQNLQHLSYIAMQVTVIRKIILQNTMQSSIQLNKSSPFVVNPNTAFFLQSGDSLIQKKLIDPSCFKSINCIQPSIQKQFEIYCQCDGIPPSIGSRLIYICGICKDILKCQAFIDRKLYKVIYQTILKNKQLIRTIINEKENVQVIDYAIITIFRKNINAYMDESDIQLFQTLKLSLFINYSAIHLKIKNILESFSKIEKNQHPITKYIELNQNLYNQQFIKNAIQLYDSLTSCSKIGTIITGTVLSGKSNLIQFVCKIRQSMTENQSFQYLKLYHDAYQYSDLIKSCLVQKKQKERSQKIQVKSERQRIQKNSYNGQIGLFQKCLQGQKQQKWIIFDGLYNKQFFQKIFSNSPNYLIPIYGMLKNEQEKKSMINRTKLMIQTVQIQNSSPSAITNYFIVPMNENAKSLQLIIKKFFTEKFIDNCLKSLSQESRQYMSSILTFNLNKVEQKGNIKNKQIKVVYPLEQFQLTFKILTLIQSVLRLNGESIRQREKNMKKVIQKFIFWSILTAISLHVDPEHQQKAQKKALQLLKCENIFTESITHYIVYPGSGLEVNLISGLRTQSCLFEIPQNGIVTVVLKNDFSQFVNTSPKGSRFYEQVSLEDPSVIRVNYNQSNSFNYFAQLLAYSNTPVILTGQPGSGKKAILDLFAKNNKNKSQLYSIKFTNKKSLMEMYQRPFRKFNSLEGVLLKSVNPNKNIIVSIEDMSLTNKEIQSVQFLRMLVNDQSYLTKFGEKRKLTESNNSLCITSNRIMIDKNISRLLSKTVIFQTSNASLQKLSSIYTPYLSSWGKANCLTGETSRIFNSSNGDTLLDATLSVYKLMNQLYNQRKGEQIFDVQTILLRPRIGDISKVLAFISRTPQANNYSLQYYSELWASQILRVFGDKFCDTKSAQYELLLKQIKKQSLLKFKQNFIYSSQSSLIFTNMITENNRYYQKVEQIQTLQQFIVNLIQSEAVTIPIKLLFNDLLIQILKIYRIIQIENGHLMLFQLNKKAREYLVQLACQIAESNYISLKKKCLSVQTDILPILDLDQNICIYQDVQDITQQQVYQFTCLLNKNYYDFNIKAETKEKIKNRISKYLKNIMAQISNRQQLQSKAINIEKQIRITSNQIKLKSQIQKNQEQTFLNQKVQEEYQATMQEIFMGNTHFIFGANPKSSKTRNLLLNQIDLIGNLHFNWFTISSQVQAKVSKQILQISNNDQSQKPKTKKNTDCLLKKCIKIYKSQRKEQNNFNDLFTLCQNVSEELDKQYQISQKKIDQWKKCIQNCHKAKILIRQHQQNITLHQSQLEQIKQQHQKLSLQLQKKANEVSDLQLNLEQNDQNEQKERILKNKNQEFQQIQNKLRQIKIKKDKNDMQCRQSRKAIKISTDFLAIVGSLQELQKKYQKQSNLKQSKQDSIIILWCIALLGCKLSSYQILQKASQWKTLIESKIQCDFKSISGFLTFFEPYLNNFSSCILGWENVSQQIKLKGVLMIFLMLHQQQLTQSNKIITIYDKWRISHHLFQSIPIDSPLGQFNLGNVLSNNNGSQFYQQIQKIKKGVIVFQQQIGQKEKRQIQKVISQRRIINFNRLASYTSQITKADVTFHLDYDFLYKYLKNLSLESNQRFKLQELKVIYNENFKNSQKIREMEETLRQKSAQIDLTSQTDTQQLAKIKQIIKQLAERQQILLKQINSQKWLPQDLSLIELIAKKFINLSQVQNQNTLNLVKKTYFLMKQISQKLHYELEEQQNINLNEKNRQNIGQNKQENIKSSKDLDKKNSETQIHKQSNESKNKDQVLKRIQQLLQNNFSKTISGKFMEFGLQTLQLTQMIPIIVVQNNLANLKLIPKDIKPLCLHTLSLSNLLIELSQQVKETHKFITFYNDQVHLPILIEIVQKYLQEWNLNNNSKNYNIFLFTNSSVAKLQEKAKQTKKVKIHYYKQQQEQLKLSQNLFKQKIAQIVKNNQIKKILSNIKDSQSCSSNDCHQKLISNYLKINANITQKAKNQKKISQETEQLIKILNNLNIKSEVQLINFLVDHTDYLEQETEIICKLVKKQISQKEIEYLICKKQTQPNNQKQSKPQRRSIIFANGLSQINQHELSIRQLNQIQEQLPFAFNISQFGQNSNAKDPLTNDLELLAVSYNNKIKKIKHNLKNILEQYTFKCSKTCFTPYTLPTSSLINEISRQYKVLKKCLSCLNIINIPPQSTIKIGSNKGIGSQADIDSIIIKNSISMSYLPFNKRLYNQIIYRACRKLKIPLSRLGVQWAIVKNNSPMISNGLTIIPQICVNLIGKIKPALEQLLKTTGQSQNTNSQILINQSKALNQVKLLMIPYDIGSSDTINMNLVMKENCLKKQSSINEKQKEDLKEKEKQIIVNKLKVAIIISATNEKIGYVQIPYNELTKDKADILIRKPIILI